MPLAHIEHYLIAADDLESTRDWYRDVLGMTEGPHPEFGFPVYWMYLGEQDVVHISQSARQATELQKRYLGRTSQNSGTGTGAVDHIAFRASGLRETMVRLKAGKVEFSLVTGVTGGVEGSLGTNKAGVPRPNTNPCT